MKKALAIFAVFTLTLAASAEPPPQIAGRSYAARVISVTDGDTIRADVSLGFNLRMSNTPIRLLSVFAPERKESTGADAAARLRKLLPVGTSIVIRPEMTGGKTPHEKQTFARYVARVWRDGVDVCDEMNRELAGKFGTGATAKR